MENREMYCTKCGNILGTKNIKNEGDIPYCASCDELFFEKSNVAMIAIVVNKKNQICLINQRVLSPFKVLIAGYRKVDETIENCVKREVQEEIGVTVTKTMFLSSHYYEKNNVLMLGFVAKTDDMDLTIDTDELESADWYEKDDCLWRMREGSIAYQLVREYISQAKGE